MTAAIHLHRLSPQTPATSAHPFCHLLLSSDNVLKVLDIVAHTAVRVVSNITKLITAFITPFIYSPKASTAALKAFEAGVTCHQVQSVLQTQRVDRKWAHDMGGVKLYNACV